MVQQSPRRGVHRIALGWVAAAVWLCGTVLLASPSTAAAASVSCDELILVGHRGYGAGPDENTIPHLQRAAEAGARSVEFDVRRTEDGVLAIMHDPRVDRTTDGTGLISQLPWRTVKALRTESGYNPPSFAMVMQSMAPLGVGLQVHLKIGFDDRALQRIGNKLRRHGFTPRTVQVNSDRLGLLRRIERITGFPTGYTYVGEATAERIDEVAAYGVDMAVMPWGQVTPEWVAYADSVGTELGARGPSIPVDWAMQTGVRRLVVDRWEQSCATRRV